MDWYEKILSTGFFQLITQHSLIEYSLKVRVEAYILVNFSNRRIYFDNYDSTPPVFRCSDPRPFPLLGGEFGFMGPCEDCCRAAVKWYDKFTKPGDVEKEWE